MLKIALLVVIAVSVQAATHAPRTTHRHPVHERFYFFNDFHSHHYVMVDNGNCYLEALTVEMESRLGDPTFIHALQIKMIGKLGDNSKLTAVSVHTLDRLEHHRCHRHVYKMSD